MLSHFSINPKCFNSTDPYLLIISNKNLTAGEIASHFKLEKATISYHLSLLKMSKLITSSRHKNYIYYSINRDTFVEVIGWLDKFRI